MTFDNSHLAFDIVIKILLIVNELNYYDTVFQACATMTLRNVKSHNISRALIKPETQLKYTQARGNAFLKKVMASKENLPWDSGNGPLLMSLFCCRCLLQRMTKSPSPHLPEGLTLIREP